MKRILTMICVLLCALTLVITSDQGIAQAIDGEQPAAEPGLSGLTDNVCQAILEKAMQTLASSCHTVGRNKACYGNTLVNTEPTINKLLHFSAVGDIADISDIRTLTTAPLDTVTGVWGISLLKLQVNLPDALPGQNVTFLIVGNTHIDNVSGDMSTFFFTSGLGAPSCKEAPKDSIIVKSPKHVQVTFTANGTQITIASTVLLRAEKGKQMSVTLVEGHAKVTTPQGSQELKPGQQVTVQLGGLNGGTAISAPSTPITVTDANDSTIDKMIAAAGQSETSADEEEPTKEISPRIKPTKPSAPDAKDNANDGGNANGNANKDNDGNGHTNNGNGSGK
jgi:hypothetical protein